MMVSESDPVNIVADYRRKNRAPKPPDPLLLQNRRSLSSIGDTHSSVTSVVGSRSSTAHSSSCRHRGHSSRGSTVPRSESSDGNSSSNNDAPSSDDNRKQRAKRNSRKQPNQSNAVPSQLRYYNSAPRWKSLLEKAKRLYRVFLACEDAFPTKDEALKEAKECISELLANEDVEDGLFILLSQVLEHDLTVFQMQTLRSIKICLVLYVDWSHCSFLFTDVITDLVDR